MPNAVFHHSQRVTYADCTLGNHVYYARYLDFLESARGEFFRALDTSWLSWQEQDFIFPVIEVRLRYKAPARYDDLIRIELWLMEAERIRLNFAYRILRESGELLAEAETHHVCTSRDEKPRRLPEALVTALAPYLQVRPWLRKS